ncbi:MAG: phenylalanine--tRNA ligase subunit alpha [Candidatus Geothermincolales bacterium]
MNEELRAQILDDPQFGTILEDFEIELGRASKEEELEELRRGYLGRKGRLTELLKRLPTLEAEERKRFGRLGNLLKGYIEDSLETKLSAVREEELRRILAEEWIDVTLPGDPIPRGSLHLITRVIEEIEDIFLGMGYRVVEGPEVELDYYNFEALNTPDWHPSKSLQDTFYVSSPFGDYPDLLLRTHTSPVQIRVMESTRPPLYVIAPGKAYRHDVPDATHSIMMHQVEGLAVDEGISFSDLKGTLECFTKMMFGEDREVRFRPHFFPFTEPSAEVDVSCIMCRGRGCRLCKGTGWLEIMGAGMVDPNVFRNVGYDPEEVTGFAFGMGVERIAMLKYGIPDIRLFYENDVRFLCQF